jgi:hypothetical protein
MTCRVLRLRRKETATNIPNKQLRTAENGRSAHLGGLGVEEKLLTTIEFVMKSYKWYLARVQGSCEHGNEPSGSIKG